jgi:hypothetical protein
MTAPVIEAGERLVRWEWTIRVGRDYLNGRGERARASLTQQSPRFMMINCTPRDSVPAEARSA